MLLIVLDCPECDERKLELTLRTNVELVGELRREGKEPGPLLLKIPLLSSFVACLQENTRYWDIW